MKILLLFITCVIRESFESNFQTSGQLGYFRNYGKVHRNKQCFNNPGMDVNVIGIEKGDKENIIRPCSTNDKQCIRKYFAKNSKCTAVCGTIPDPYKLDRITQYYPFANITAVQTEFTATGLSNSKITEFYVNQDTGNLVFALGFRNFNESSPKAYFRYKRTGKESLVLSDYTSVFYSSGTFTAVIPKIPHLRLDLAEIHAFIDDGAPPFVIGPAAYNSTDPDVVAAFVKFSSDIPTAIQEAFLFKSQLYMATYIQTHICNFGLKVFSV